MAGADRNRPCHCGSGKKYKKCCKGKQVSNRYTREEGDIALSLLYDAVDDSAWEDVIADVGDAMWGTLDPEAAGIDDPNILNASDTFIDWYLFFDYELEEGGRVADLMLETNGHELPPGIVTFLRLARSSHVRVYEATEVRPGVGVTLRDVLTEELTRVQERTASHEMARGSVVAARLLPSGRGGDPIIDGGILPFLPAWRGRMLNDLRNLAHTYRSEFGALDDRFFEDVCPILHQHWIRQMVPPVVVNSAGQPVTLVISSFDVGDRTAIQRALDGNPAFRRADSEEPRWSWNDGDQPAGAIELGSDGLFAMTDSEERAERQRQSIESIAGNAVRFRDRVSEPAPIPPAELSDELRAAIEAKLDAHYRDWLDEPIPRLDGQTPRAAAKDERLRQRVRDMLVEMEQMAESSREAGQPAFDPSWMWEELRLER